MTITEIFDLYLVEGEFNDLFIQMFVNMDNSFAYLDFNRIHETNFTHKQIQAALKEVIGSKVVKFKEPLVSLKLLESFMTEYQFGKYTHAKDWNLYLWDMYGEVLPRRTLLSFVAGQKPSKSTKSFLPSHDGNLYAKDEFVQRTSEL